MSRGLVGLFVACVALFSTSPLRAQTIFANGFETPCPLLDADGDRLSGCQEEIAQTSPANPDTDGDGLSDGDEVLGTEGGLNLPALGVNPRRKDILIEFDWFVDSSEQGLNEHCPLGTHSHQPTQEMLDIAKVMYGAAPVTNPNGTQGINLIFDIGQGGAFSGGTQVVDTTGAGDGLLESDTSGDDYNNHYNINFAQNRKGYFHYALMVHRFVYFDGRTDYSGVAEVSAGLMRDEIVISLYCQRSARNLGHTLAHELGHNLGLRHGGDSNCNNKPNYNSIMNYRFSFAGIDIDCDGNVYLGPPGFSQGLRNTLNENNLNEAEGLCGGVPLDWNGVNGIEASVERDVNVYNGQVADCGGTHTVLTDYNDWANIVVDMTPNGNEQGNIPEELIVCPPPEVLP